MKAYKMINRHTQEVKTFKSWEALDLANLDIRTWGRPIMVSDTPVDDTLTVLKKVYINPTLWCKDVVIRSLDDLTGIYVNGDTFSYMNPNQLG